MKTCLLLAYLSCLPFISLAYTMKVGKNQAIKTIKAALSKSQNGDTILVYEGLYKEGNIIVEKAIYLWGIGYPILDGETKYEIISIKTNEVTIRGFKLQNSGYATLNDPCAIKVYDSQNVRVLENILCNNFFGIYIQYGKNCIVKNNKITSNGIEEQQIGNGIHCWKSDSLQIIGNQIKGHRDGIYFEFVTNSIIWRNTSSHNVRYGLHFMFSNHDAYITNIFKHNGAGVAVMFSKHIKMFHNWFSDNWSDSAYGLLLKEISDGYILNNYFFSNTSGIFMEGTNRIIIEKNVFKNNGWGMKIQASCMDNEIRYNNFLGNTFDITTNGTIVLNVFEKNYWDKYTGYDLDKNNIGDVPYHPLSLFSVIAEKNPAVMLLYGSFMVGLLDKSEKIIPSLTPDNFIDKQPLMRTIIL